jgi:hypothetical protein
MELSLEENRAQRGSAGYVDMVRIFKLYPETSRAKESFADAVRQAEEGVNLRKADLIRLRAELSGLKAERATLAMTLPEASAPAIPSPSTTTATAPVLAGSTAPALAGSTALALAGSTAAATALAPAPEKPPAPSPASAALADLDSRIEKKTAEISLKEDAHRTLQAAAERNLLDLEARKTEVLLGKIHRAIMETARKEGISVVVDKNNILYGHEAVDLTEKVIQALRGG